MAGSWFNTLFGVTEFSRRVYWLGPNEAILGRKSWNSVAYSGNAVSSAAVAGWLAGKIMEGRGFGLIGNVIVGIVGAFLAGTIFPALGFSVGGGVFSSIFFATIGAVILLFVIGLVKSA